VDLEVEVLLPEAEEERCAGVLLLAFDMGVGDDLGIRTGADMVESTEQIFCDGRWRKRVIGWGGAGP